MRDGHGDDLHRYERIRANFSSNVTSLTDPTSLREYLRGEIDRIGSYPEPTAALLGKSLAKHHGLADGEVLVTSGATEGIYLIAQAYIESSYIIIALIRPSVNTEMREDSLHVSSVSWKLSSLVKMPLRESIGFARRIIPRGKSIRRTS